MYQHKAVKQFDLHILLSRISLNSGCSAVLNILVKQRFNEMQYLEMYICKGCKSALGWHTEYPDLFQRCNSLQHLEMYNVVKDAKCVRVQGEYPDP